MGEKPSQKPTPQMPLFFSPSYMLLVSLTPVDDRGKKVCETKWLDGAYEGYVQWHVLCWVFRRSVWGNT